jgi:hypothetical protein
MRESCDNAVRNSALRVEVARQLRESCRKVATCAKSRPGHACLTQLSRWRLRTGIPREAEVAGSTIVLLGVFEHGLDESVADPRTRSWREVDSSPVHVGVACRRWII